MTASHVPGAVRLSDPDHDLTAAFVPGAGMIGASLRHRGEELLGQRRGLEAYRMAGKTMGIPLLYPWANRLGALRYTAAGRTVDHSDGAPGVRLDPNGLPIHGLLAASPDWVVTPPVVEDDERNRLVATWAFADHTPLLRSFPYPHEVELQVTLSGGRLVVATTVTPSGEAAVPVAFGFHPYLTLPGVSRAEWQVELPAMRHRPVDGVGLPTGETTPVAAESFRLADRTFDVGYDELAPGAAFVLAGGGRRLTVCLEEGFPAAQIFAPAEDDVICFEPMAAPTNALVTGDGLRDAEPGGAFRAVFSIEVAGDR